MGVCVDGTSGCAGDEHAVGEGFGELEFWFSLIKVLALAIFLVVGVYFVIFGTPIEGHVTGFSIITDNGGFFPNGILPAFVIIQG